MPCYNYKTFYKAFGNFVFNSYNELAFRMCQFVAQKGRCRCHPLLIYGPSGCGKTHLLLAIKSESGEVVGYFLAEDLVKNAGAEAEAEAYSRYDVILIDSLDELRGTDAQDRLFALIKRLDSAGIQVVLATNHFIDGFDVFKNRLLAECGDAMICDIRGV